MEESQKKHRAKLTLSLGALIRGTVINSIKNNAFRLDVEVKIDESWSLLDSDYRIELIGKKEDVEVIRESIRRLMVHINS